MIETKFKHTDIGLVPVDWEVSSFGTEFKKLNAASYTWSETIREGSCAYLHYGDIHTKYHDHLNVEKEELPFISDAKASRFTKLKDGDLVMLNASEDYDGVNDCVEITNCKRPLIAGQHTIPLRPKTGKLVNCFIGYIPSIPSVQMQLVENAVGTKVYGITNELLQTVLFPIPSKQEQQDIASVLMNFEVLISNLDKLIVKKQAIMKGAMQELLTGKKRLPGFKEEWKEERMGSLVSTITTGKLDANAMSKTGQYPFFTCAKDVYLIDRYDFDAEALLISGNGENVGYIHYYKGKFNAYQRTYVMMGFKCDIAYLEQYLKLRLKDRIKTEKSDSNTPYIKMDTLSDMIINIPDNHEEQKAIAHVLSTMEIELSLLKQKRDKYRQIKQGMMHDLLTGRIRLIRGNGSEKKAK